MNYFLHEDTIIDLENNIPFLYSPVNSTMNERDDRHLVKEDFENVKNVFNNSSKFLSIYDRE
jgi:hypothetical protein